MAEAYARLQTILSDRERMTFATQYNRNEVVSNNNQNTQADRKNVSMKNRMHNQPEFVAKQERSDYQSNPNFAPRNEQKFANKPSTAGVNKNEPMEIDAASMNVNVDHKRKFNTSGSNQYSRQHKLQRVNNIENETGEYEENDDIDETQSEASIFLDL